MKIPPGTADFITRMFGDLQVSTQSRIFAA
jgi:hypothetical protein